MILRVANWRKVFENNRTAELKTMPWCPVPTKQDGDGYTELLDHPRGTAHYGAWMAILLVAAKCNPRGTLVRSGRNGASVPHDATSLSRINRVPVRLLKEAIERLLAIGWLEIVSDEALSEENAAPAPQAPAAIPQEVAASRAGATRENRTGQERTGQETAGATLPDLPAYLDALRRLHPKFANEFAVTNALAEVSRLLPPLAEFEATLSAWAATEQWTEAGGKFAPAPPRWLRDGGFRTTPPAPKRAPKPARTVDQVRSEDVRPALLAALRAKRLTRERHDDLLDRASAATTVQELQAIAHEIPHAAA